MQLGTSMGWCSDWEQGDAEGHQYGLVFRLGTRGPGAPVWAGVQTGNKVTRGRSPRGDSERQGVCAVCQEQISLWREGALIVLRASVTRRVDERACPC